MDFGLEGTFVLDSLEFDVVSGFLDYEFWLGDVLEVGLGELYLAAFWEGGQGLGEGGNVGGNVGGAGGRLGFEV